MTQPMPFYRFALLLFGVALLNGCASLMTEMDPPKVSLESFRSLPSEAGAPRFEIKLRVLNPNEQALDIVGISYSIELLNKELISGVTSDVPLIEGYSEGVVTLNASLQLFEVLRLLASVGSQPTDELSYRFTAKIDFGGFMPTQRIVETGEITLQ